MKISEVLRLAARSMERDDAGVGMCCHVDEVQDEKSGYDSPAHKYLVRLLKPRNGGVYWGNLWEENALECRILALCLAAAIAESEGL